MTLSCHTWQPLGLRFEIFKVQHSLNLIHLHPIQSNLGDGIKWIHSTGHLNVGWISSKADFKFSSLNSLHDFWVEQSGRKIDPIFRAGSNFHGLVDPLFVTSWHKWNRYKLHRGKSLCHGTRNGPMEVYDLCHGSRRGFFWPLLDPMEQVWFSQPACASGTSTTYANLLVPPGPSPMTNFRVIPYQKPKRS